MNNSVLCVPRDDLQRALDEIALDPIIEASDINTVIEVVARILETARHSEVRLDDLEQESLAFGIRLLSNAAKAKLNMVSDGLQRLVGDLEARATT